MTFDAKNEIKHIVSNIRQWFMENGPASPAVIGISGGKDSTIAAALLVKALGPDRVFGILMPNGTQPDLEDSFRVINHLKIRGRIINIGPMVESVLQTPVDFVDYHNLGIVNTYLSRASHINLPPRIRMAVLYAMAQGMDGRVINTCNRSEEYVGYSTKYGDAAGDYAPLMEYTVTELLIIGKALGLPADLVQKTPADGLCGETDEDRFGFSYETLDKFILYGTCRTPELKEKIMRMHNASAHKRRPMESCPPSWTM